MAGGDKLLPIEKMFSKGFIWDKGNNKTPDYYADDLWNIRIKNGGITPRLGYEDIFDGLNANAVQGITSNNSRLYVVQDQNLREINYTLDPVTQSNIGGISSAGKVRFINYGIYTIILTGIGFPRVWDGATLTQLTASNIAVNTNPSLGTRFAGYTVVNNLEKKNTIRISRPITVANQEYCYDWVTTPSETLSFDTNVIGMIGTLNNLWVFTEGTIESMGKSNITSTGGIASLYTVPVGKGYELMNHDCIVSAGDMIFFLTRNKKIGSIGYMQGVLEPQIALLSDADSNSIDGYMQDVLDDNQSDAFGVFDAKNNLVKWHVKRRNSITNDIVIIRDIQHKTWLKDSNKFYSCATILKDEVYAGNALGYFVSHDEYGENDNNDGINVYYECTDQVFGQPSQQKQFRGNTIAGQINNLSKITRKILVDGTVVYDKIIDGEKIATGYLPLGIGTNPIGTTPIGGNIYQQNSGLYDFEKTIDRASLKKNGKRIKIIIECDSIGQNWIIDYLSFVVRIRTRENIQDKD